VEAFCRARRVGLQVCLTGGDPFCSPHFWPIYEAIGARGLAVSILGNPVDGDRITRLLAVRPPLYFQVSLEGLASHNDAVRGAGHYDQTMRFLREARTLGLRTHVMLTLTHANIGDVLPLGEELRRLTCRFTFNRLAQVGRGAELAGPSADDLAAFLPRYLAARRGNPVLGVKDNLLNIVRRRAGRPLLPGCTGFGCGAAFNFVALLPDGEVHACRKFPSPIGDVRRQGFGEIYDSPAAARYRAGPEACRRCSLRDACRGCMAVTCGEGLDPLVARDPGCFIDGSRYRISGRSEGAGAASSTLSRTSFPAHSVEMSSSSLTTPPSGVRT